MMALLNSDIKGQPWFILLKKKNHTTVIFFVRFKITLARTQSAFMYTLVKVSCKNIDIYVCMCTSI